MVSGGELQQFSLFAKLGITTLFFPAFFTVGTLALNPSKLFFLITVPFLTINLLRGAYGRILATDILVFSYVTWMALAMFTNHGFGEAIEYIGSNALIILGGYLIGRGYIRSQSEFIGFIKFLLLIIVISLPFALYEARTSVALVLQWISNIPSFYSHVDVMNRPEDMRMGLWRAQFSLPHPIHYGLFCSMLFSFCYVGLLDHVSHTRRVILSSIVFLCCFLSLSSGALLAVMCQIALIVWLRITWSTEARWKILWSIVIFFYTIIELASNRLGIYAVVERLTFSPETAFYRRLLFEIGTNQVGQTPIFGVGRGHWGAPEWMTGSLDNFWLLLAVLYGLPTLIMFALAIFWALFAVGARDFSAHSDLLRSRQAWIFTMVSLILSLATVAVWDETYSLVMLVLASGLWMISVPTEQSAAAPGPVIPSSASVPEPPRGGTVYTRFPAPESRGRGGPPGRANNAGRRRPARMPKT